MEINRRFSKRIGLLVGAKNRECWNNAVKATAYLGPAARYVEGWVVTDLGLLVEHGWVELPDCLVDPTPAYVKQKRCRYFPGVRYELQQVLDQDGKLMPLAKMHTPGYGEAYEQAHVAAYGCTPAELAVKLDRIQNI